MAIPASWVIDTHGFLAAADAGAVPTGIFGLIVENKLRPIPAKGWAEMIRKVYEVDPLLCPQCGGQMKVIAFLTDYSMVDRIIDHSLLSKALQSVLNTV